MDANQIYILARAAGFTWSAAQTAVAICLAESGGDPNQIGDTHLTTAKWGPSVGLMQIRSLKAETGTGKSRDANRLKDPLFNMKAAYTESAAGVNWTPWSTYTTTDPKRSYKRYMATAIGARLSQDPILAKKLDQKKDWLSILIDAGIRISSPIAGGAIADGVDAGGDAVAGAIVNTVGDPLAAAKSALELLAKAGAWTADSHNWARVALVVAGAAGILAGLTMLAKAGAGPVSTAAGVPAKAAKAAASVIPAGRIAGAAGKATMAAKAVAK